MRSVFYVGGCRQTYLSQTTKAAPSGSKMYLHPEPDRTRRLYGSMEYYTNTATQFITELYDKFLVNIPMYNTILKRNNVGVFFTRPPQEEMETTFKMQICPIAHIVLAFVRSHERLIEKFGMPSTWETKTFISAIRRMRRDGAGLMLKLFATAEGLAVPVGMHTLETTERRSYKPGVVRIPHDVKLSKKDEEIAAHFKWEIKRSNKFKF